MPNLKREGGRPPKNPDDQIVLPYRPPLYGVVVSKNSTNKNLKAGGGQLMLQHLFKKGKHGSDRTSPGVLMVKGTPFDKQVPLQSIGPSCGRCSC